MVYKHRLNIAELTKNEQDFYVMGIVRAALMDTSDRSGKRQRKRSSYSYQGKKVCLFAFLYLENLTIYQLKKIRIHVMKHGVVAIQHGNSHKIPHNAFPLDLYKRVENFLRVYLNLNLEKSKNRSIPLSQPLSKVYQDYKDHDKEAKQFMGYTTFRTFFKKQFPQVRLSTQATKANPSNPQQPSQVVHENVYELEDAEIIYENPDDLIYYEAEISQDEETATRKEEAEPSVKFVFMKNE